MLNLQLLHEAFRLSNVVWVLTALVEPRVP
ncbi:hypothetical protein SBC2_85470 (plasmid) [Caballeronia sp. SBC2]|nr:hypothetical protein SBC2_85470 [Caballeronia sp. SBC2]